MSVKDNYRRELRRVVDETKVWQCCMYHCWGLFTIGNLLACESHVSVVELCGQRGSAWLAMVICVKRNSFMQQPLYGEVSGMDLGGHIKWS